MLRLLLIIAAFIIYGSLYPFRFDFDRVPGNPLWVLLHAWPATIDRFAWRDALVNILLYFPFGLTAVLVLARRLPRAVAALVTVLLAIALSATIEMMQIFDAARTCSLLDVSCNGAGAVVGLAVALVFRENLATITRRRRADRGAWGGLLLALCWAGWQLYPFIPMLGRSRLRANFAHFLATPISPVELYASGAEWFAFALLMRTVAGRMKATWLALAMSCLPLRLLISERNLAPAEVLGALLAMLVWTYPAEGSRVRAGAFALAVAIVLRELAPFTFAGPPHAFSWIPFAATLDAERLSSALVVLRKSFEYGALIWLLRAAGMRIWMAGAAVAAALLLLEIAQRYLPNRQPELTDTLIAALFTCILWVSPQPRPHAEPRA